MKRLIPLFLSFCLLMGCGSSNSLYDSVSDSHNSITSAGSASGFGSYNGINSANNHNTSIESSTNKQNTSTTNNNTSTKSESDTTFSKDMLIYRGSVELTTKQYEESIKALRSIFDTYDCFIEESRAYTATDYNDNPLRRYTATIRVASKDYETMMNVVSELGAIEDKQSSVENLNVEYSDITTALRIYRAREDRYLKLLEQCENETDAIAIEDKLTEIAVTIAQYESRKTVIETDVAYSYIDVVIKEVKEYTSQIQHSDNFFVRLWKEIVNTFFGFINFVEALIFFIIRISPYLLLIWLILFVAKKVKLIDWFKKLWTKY